MIFCIRYPSNPRNIITERTVTSRVWRAKNMSPQPTLSTILTSCGVWWFLYLLHRIVISFWFVYNIFVQRNFVFSATGRVFVELPRWMYLNASSKDTNKSSCNNHADVLGLKTSMICVVTTVSRKYDHNMFKIQSKNLLIYYITHNTSLDDEFIFVMQSIPSK